ncbi:MAG TPA: hypothetical protein VNN25_05310 [Thermoanaerobaculia bacterium]|nr:hypothetical protein [Thermoanaerobaculia bacterium]
MKNPYEEEAARYMAALQAIGSAINDLAATAPPPPGPMSRRARKVTPAVIRRWIADLRSGKMRPIDPLKDPNILADELEGELMIIAAMVHAGSMLQRVKGSLLSRIETKAKKTLAEAMTIFREARGLARTSDDEALKERVRRMDRALGRGVRRKVRIRR